MKIIDNHQRMKFKF